MGKLRVLRRCGCMMVLAGLALAVPGMLEGGQPPPNWKATVTGQAVAGSIVIEGGRPVRLDTDTLGGNSSHLGKFTATGSHKLYLDDFTFAGEATYVAANGDKLFVTYEGYLFPGDDPDYPFAFLADITAQGGTGRLRNAAGNGIMSGAFNGVSLAYYFSIDGTLSPNGK